LPHSAARIPVYRGAFGLHEAERLLWRAGFGPRRGQARALARKGLDDAVKSLTAPGRGRMVGPKPRDDKGRPLAPRDAWGHDHLWWLDRMVRSNRPLVERMTLVWHDWFATSNEGVGSQTLMLRQNALFRRYWLGSFEHLLLEVTKDPAMLIWLSGTENTKWSPNENYGRELMELFTLGASRGYTERDVREQARALTGFRNDWRRSVGPTNFRFDRERHDLGVKRIFGKRGKFDWRDSCRLCLHHRNHPSFFVQKLWSYFIPVAPPHGTQKALEHLYVSRGYAVRPVVEAILKHPLLYKGPRMVKPPIVFTAGLLRASGHGVDTESWTWLCANAGQQLFFPPNVAGWNDDRWLDTASYLARWDIAGRVTRPAVLESGKDKAPFDADKLVERALRFWGNPSISPKTRRVLLSYTKRAMRAANQDWKRKSYPPLIENSLRHLIAVSPDLQTS
jgi:uncharacterized protein (DUF1800 family)